MSELLLLSADGSTHPLVAAALGSATATRRIAPGDAGSLEAPDALGLVIADASNLDAVVALIEAPNADLPVIVVPDPALLRALGERLSAEVAGRVVVACAGRFEPAAAAIAGSVAAGTLGLPWGIHIESLGDPRPVLEVALDLADLAALLTASRLLAVERLGDGMDPLVLIPELDHGLVASLTVIPPRPGAAPSTLLRIDASHGQASADLLSPAIRVLDGPRRFGPTGHGLLLDAALAGSAPADLRLPAVLERLGSVLTALL